MAGRGPPPKTPATRRNRSAPSRGDWIILRPVGKRPVLPALPKRTNREGAWSARTKRQWAAWRKDPATTQYGETEIVDALELAYLVEEHVREGGSRLATEIRQRKDSLGLTLKGKRDLRWMVASAEEDPSEEDELARQRARRDRRERVRAIDRG